MRLTKKAAILKILMVLSGVFCFADIHSAYEEAVRVYTEYRKVRSAEQILNLDSIREDLLITDKMKEFSCDGIDTLIFHAYNPTIYICEDDYVVTGIDKTNNSYYLKVSEGKKVEVDIQIIYDSNSKRPKRFEVKSIIVDKKGIQEIKKYKFYN